MSLENSHGNKSYSLGTTDIIWKSILLLVELIHLWPLQKTTIYNHTRIKILL